MNIKPRHKRRFFWTMVSLIGIAIIGIICIPPFINLNKMKPILQDKLYEQTGLRATINGDINFSLLGSTTIVAHDITIPNGKIASISFSLPLKQIFNLQNATLNKTIGIHNGKIKITNPYPYDTPHQVNIYNTTVDFMNHDYQIVRGTLGSNKFNGQIRTAQHKYDISFDNGEFIVLNSNDNLHIRGTLFPGGGAAGEMSIATNDINKWFEFENPKILEPVSLSMDFNWDGQYGFDFTNIHANNYFGDIKLFPNGYKNLNFTSTNANLDLSFIANDKSMINNSQINFDLSGNIKFKQKVYSKFQISADGVKNTLQLKTVVADDIELFGGTYDTNGLHNTRLVVNNLPENFSCAKFSGTTKKWDCANFTYGNIYGDISYDNGVFHISATSRDKMPNQQSIRNMISYIGDTGTLDFTFENMSGTMVITPNQMIPKYKFAKHTTLNNIGLNLKFLPDFMYTTYGTFTTQGNQKTFVAENNSWTLRVSDKDFNISGNNFKNWLPNIDLRFLKNMPYAISGIYNDDAIGDLNIMIGGHIISGVATKSGLTLKTQMLNIDKFMNELFTTRFDEQKFLTNHPLATLFELPVNISLSADSVIWNGQEYKNFVYTLKPDTQVFSISDSARGNLLGIIEKKKFDYDISIQLNKFQWDGNFLTFYTPLNVSNSMISGEAKLHTSGQTANDIIYNLVGDIDISFTGGEIQGFGFDEFYASAPELNILNTEYALSSILESGTTRLKRLKIVGKYNNGNFETTEPLTISMPHVDGVGALFINNNIVTGTFEFVMRGTAIKPATVEISINEKNKRYYSLSEILKNIDVGYMRAFVNSNTTF